MARLTKQQYAELRKYIQGLYEENLSASLPETWTIVNKFYEKNFGVLVSRATLETFIWSVRREMPPSDKKPEIHKPDETRAILEAAENKYKHQISALQEESKLLRKQAKEKVKEATVLMAFQKGVELVGTQVALQLPSFSRQPPRMHPKDVLGVEAKKHTEEAVLFQSCWHYGEVITPAEISGFGGYSTAICKAEVQNMTDSVIALATEHHKGLNIRKLWVVNVGDNVSGIIHDELQITNERPIVPQIMECALLHALSLRDLAQTYAQVEFVGIIGNHGRTTKRLHYKEKASDSFDRLVYEMLALLVRGINNIKVTIPNQPKYLMTINGHNFLFEHGDSIMMWMGFPHYGASREQARLLTSYVNARSLVENKELADYMAKGFRYFCFGNFHTSMITDGPGGSEMIATGSLKGYDEYAWNRLSTGSLPSQLFFGVHKKRGISFRYKLDLSDNSPKKFSRYQFDVMQLTLRDAAKEAGLL